MFEFLKKIFSRQASPSKNPPPDKKDLVGNVTHYYGKAGAAVFKVKNGSLAIGDRIRVYGKHVDFEQTVETMEIDRKPIQKAAKGDEIGLGIRNKVHENDGIYRLG